MKYFLQIGLFKRKNTVVMRGHLWLLIFCVYVCVCIWKVLKANFSVICKVSLTLFLEIRSFAGLKLAK